MRVRAKLGGVCTLALTLFWASPGACQEPHQVVYWSAVSADWATTYVGLKQGGQEMNATISWGKTPAGIVGLAVAEDVGCYWLAHTLIGKKHPKLEKAVMFGLSGFRGYLAARNIRITRGLK